MNGFIIVAKGVVKPIPNWSTEEQCIISILNSLCSEGQNLLWQKVLFSKHLNKYRNPKGELPNTWYIFGCSQPVNASKSSGSCLIKRLGHVANSVIGSWTYINCIPPNNVGGGTHTTGWGAAPIGFVRRYVVGLELDPWAPICGGSCPKDGGWL